MKKYNFCLEIARKYHLGQTRKFSNEEYITHPIRVSEKFIDEKMKCIAVLHDVLEDTSATKYSLTTLGVDQDIIKVIEILSRRVNETYLDFILRISKHKKATLIKIEDITDNLSDLKEGSLKDKYRFAKHFLRNKK